MPVSENQERRVLVVEDDPIIANFLSDILTDAAYEVVGPCLTYQQALEQLLTAVPPYAVLDLKLSDTVPAGLGMEGQKLLAILQSCNARVVVHSGMTEQFDTLIYYYPEYRFLSKPASPQQLLRALAEPCRDRVVSTARQR